MRTNKTLCISIPQLLLMQIDKMAKREEELNNRLVNRLETFALNYRNVRNLASAKCGVLLKLKSVNPCCCIRNVENPAL